LGQALIRKSIRLDRSILDMQANGYLEFLIHSSIEHGAEHESRLWRVFQQLPPELAWIKQYCGAAVARGYLYRGVDAVMWGRLEQGKAYLIKASDLGARLDEQICYILFDRLADYEAEYGPVDTRTVVQNLTQHLAKVGPRKIVRWCNGVYFVNRAFRDYHQGRYETVPNSVLRAVLSSPAYLANRGVVTILFRSFVARRTSQPGCELTCSV
jgi:hypothetical protein